MIYATMNPTCLTSLRELLLPKFAQPVSDKVPLTSCPAPMVDTICVSAVDVVLEIQSRSLNLQRLFSKALRHGLS